MATLDYAYLADAAQVQGGKLFSLGASFTHVQVPAVGVGFSMAIAGRIKAHQGEECPLHIAFATPDDQLMFEVDTTLRDDGTTQPYGENGDKVGLLFALTTQIPIVAPGLYVVRIDVGGVERRLAFDVEVIEP